MGVTKQSASSRRTSVGATKMLGNSTGTPLTPIAEETPVGQAQAVQPRPQLPGSGITAPTISQLSPLDNLISNLTNDLTKWTDPSFTESETYKTVKRRSLDAGLAVPSKAEVAKYESKSLPLIPSPTLPITEIGNSEWRPGRPSNELKGPPVSEKRKSQIGHLHSDADIRVAGESQTDSDPTQDLPAVVQAAPAAWMNRMQKRAQGHRKMLEHYCEKAGRPTSGE